MPGGVRSMKGEKQMIYKNITFKADPFSYNLEFDDRITLVGGDSGTGKTVLYEMLEDLRLTNEYKAINQIISQNQLNSAEIVLLQSIMQII